MLVLLHGGRHRATLKSIAGESAVLFVRVQQRNWILLPRILPEVVVMNDTDALHVHACFE